MNQNTAELRTACAQQLLSLSSRASQLAAFVGLDGFVDEILDVVDKRHSAEKFDRLPTIARLAERLAGASGKSTNLELVNRLTKLGGNGPIMANALARFGLRVTYVGNLGYPTLHPVFADFARRAEVHSIAPPGLTDALEFEDGKIMLGKHTSLREVTWANLVSRFGKDKLTARFQTADLIGFVNWTMLPYMSEIWAAVLREIGPQLSAGRRTFFFDLADPEKRTGEDIRQALDLILQFRQLGDVVLGLNEKEAMEVARVLGLRRNDASRQSLAALAVEIHARVPVATLVVHPVAYALSVTAGRVTLLDGLYTAQPFLTTGAGDHFNAGFCLARLLGFADDLALLTAVTSSGYYAIKGQSPTVADLVRALENWPTREVGPYAF